MSVAGGAGRLKGWRLVADIGGTNARFARAVSSASSASAGGELCDVTTLRVCEFSNFDDALAGYLASFDAADGCVGAAVAAAGPVEAGCVRLTNAPWTIDRRRLSEALGGVPALLVNDLAAVAMALPYLSEADAVRVCGGDSCEAHTAAMLAVNVGTGFGAAAILPHEGGWCAVPGEAGHMCLPDLRALVGGDTARRIDAEAFALVEDLLSGRGIVAAYAALGGAVDAGMTAAQVFEASSAAEHDDAAISTVRIAGRVLGRVAGDLTLATGAWAGVYLTGSVVDGLARCGDVADFAEAFVAKGPMAGRMAAVPVRRIKRAEPALFGLARARLGGQ